MTAASTNTGDACTQGTHLFAWNGVAFRVPDTWHLSSHHSFKGVHRVEMEDDTSARLELEWTRPRQAVDRDAVSRRYAKQSTKLASVAERSGPVKNLPEGWNAVLYDMPERRKLLIAYHLAADIPLFSFFRLHFGPQDRENPPAVLRRVAESFCFRASGPILWRFYDVALEMDSEFHLTETSLRAGNKLMVFQWRLRRLLIWHVSLADVVLAKRSLADWAVEFLGNVRALRGPRFSSRPDGTIIARPTWRYPFGHYEEIARQCFRYHVGYRHLPERNQIALWVFNYRRPEDISALEKSLALLPLDPNGRHG